MNPDPKPTKTPRIVRPRDDGKKPLVGAALFVACLAGGYFGAKRLFEARSHAPVRTEGAADAPDDPATVAGTTAVDAAAAVDAALAAVAPLPEVPAVPVRVLSVFVQGCGDGEELTIPGARCERVATVETALRTRLAQMGSCPAAEVAAANPNGTLSLGLRVDFARKRVTPLPGRSSSVPNALAHVACARALFTADDPLFATTAPHVRYLYFFSLRYGPMAPRADGGTALAPASSTPSEPLVQSAGVQPSIAPVAPVVSVTATPAVPAVTAAAVAPVEPPFTGGVPLPHPEPATLVWDRVALRDRPRDGAILLQLPRETAVEVIARAGSWFKVRYNRREGWLYGAAIGR